MAPHSWHVVVQPVETWSGRFQGMPVSTPHLFRSSASPPPPSGAPRFPPTPLDPVEAAVPEILSFRGALGGLVDFSGSLVLMKLPPQVLMCTARQECDLSDRNRTSKVVGYSPCMQAAVAKSSRHTWQAGRSFRCPASSSRVQRRRLHACKQSDLSVCPA